MTDDKLSPAEGTPANEVAPGAETATPQFDWPDDWRDRFAGEDKTFRRQLERYASPTDLARKARSLERKLSSGEYRRDLPANASDEDKAAWRAERGYCRIVNLPTAPMRTSPFTMRACRR
jgi:hypothetical protein